MADAILVQDPDETHVPSELVPYAVMYVPPCRHAMQADRKHGARRCIYIYIYIYICQYLSIDTHMVIIYQLAEKSGASSRSASRSSRRPRRSDGARLKKDPAEGREWIHHLARDRSTRGSEALGASTVHLSVTLATWVPTPGRDEHQQQRHSKGVQLETTAGRIISFREGYSRAWC